MSFSSLTTTKRLTQKAIAVSRLSPSIVNTIKLSPQSLWINQSAKSQLRAHTNTSCHFSTNSTKMASSKTIVPGRPTWQQSMLRIADPEKSLAFYRDLMGMTVIDKLDFPQYEFALYFLTTLPEGESYDLTPGTQEAHVSISRLWKKV